MALIDFIIGCVFFPLALQRAAEGQSREVLVALPWSSSGSAVWVQCGSGSGGILSAGSDGIGVGGASERALLLPPKSAGGATQETGFLPRLQLLQESQPRAAHGQRRGIPCEPVLTVCIIHYYACLCCSLLKSRQTLTMCSV